MKLSVFIATSLDGFIADENGGIDWLNKANESIPPGEDCGFSQFYATVDVLIMGRNTFNQVIQFKEWPYGNTPVFVLSNTLKTLPSNCPTSVNISNSKPDILIKELIDKGFKHGYIDGGITIQNFLKAGLLNEITVTLIPVTLGTGKLLFSNNKNETWFKLIQSKSYSFGFVQNTYQVNNCA